MLKTSAYPQSSPEEWLVFVNPWQKHIDPVFAGRLAALASSYNQKMIISSGFRSYKEQQSFYRILRGKGALKPGTSWHEFGGAVDTISQWLLDLENCHIKYQYTLKKYGLCKPLAKGNGYYPTEEWHLQPIELAFSHSLAVKMKFYRSYR